MKIAALSLLLVLVAGSAGADTPRRRVWEVNGIRLEEPQIQRLALDIARQTVVAVRRIREVQLREAQAQQLESIYRDVALGVYDRAVQVVNRSDIDDPEKERLVKSLVLDGQERSTEQVGAVLDPEQYALYRAWERRQVDAFERRGLWTRKNRRRRSRR